jgi:hypothetical protein
VLKRGHGKQNLTVKFGTIQSSMKRTEDKTKAGIEQNRAKIKSLSRLFIFWSVCSITGFAHNLKTLKA